MKLIAHRGFWRDAQERNTMVAFERALSAGYGIETDLRDLDGELVISHDPPCVGAMHAAPFFELVQAHGDAPVAINIKADGLQQLVADAIAGLGPERLFVFDMSVPDTLSYLKLGIPVFVRHSEYEEPPPLLLSKARGVWLDSFHDDWFTRETVEGHRRCGRAVCIVSPELHGRKHEPLWERMASWGCAADDCISLCTDFPDRARRYFDG